MTPTERAAPRHTSAISLDDCSTSSGSASAGWLESIFDSARHKVLYEIDAVPQEGQESRIYVRRGSGLITAIGYLDARRRLGQEHGIVLVTDNPGWRTGLKRALPRLQQVVRGLLLVAPTPHSGSVQRRLDPDPDIAVLRGAGWDVVEFPESTDPDELACGLMRARDNAAPALVLVPSDVLRTTFASTAEASRPLAGKDSQRLHIEAMVAELRRRIAADLRVSLVLAVRDEDWLSLVEQHPGRAVSMDPQDVASVIPWCRAMSLAGCHPVLVAGVRTFMRHRQGIARDLADQHLRSTIIVLDDPSAGPDRFSPLPDLDGRMVSVHADAATAVATLDECLDARHPTLLYVAARANAGSQTVVPAAGGDEPPSSAAQMPAESSGERAQEHARRTANPETRQIRSFQFSGFERTWIRGYRRVGKRDLYLWRWTGCAVNWLTLSCVTQELRRDVCETKFLAAMFNVLLDDLIDERHDPDAMRDVMRLMSDDAAAADVVTRLGAYGEFTRQVWGEIWRRVACYPRYREFQRLLLYDFKQLGNTVDYSELLYRHPSLINQTEHDLYSPHGMMVACAATLDLMCSPDFDVEELGRLREVLWHANSMARIGNLMSTWQREIGDDDFSSGVFAHAVSQGWLNPEDLSSTNRDRIEAAVRESGGEREYTQRWQRHRERLMQMSDRLRSVSVPDLADGLERLFASELISRGRK